MDDTWEGALAADCPRVRKDLLQARLPGSDFLYKRLWEGASAADCLEFRHGFLQARLQMDMAMSHGRAGELSSPLRLSSKVLASERGHGPRRGLTPRHLID